MPFRVFRAVGFSKNRCTENQFLSTIELQSGPSVQCPAVIPELVWVPNLHSGCGHRSVSQVGIALDLQQRPAWLGKLYADHTQRAGGDKPSWEMSLKSSALSTCGEAANGGARTTVRIDGAHGEFFYGLAYNLPSTPAVCRSRAIVPANGPMPTARMPN